MNVRMVKKKQENKKQRFSLKNIQQLFFRTQLVLIISLALILGIAGSLINIHFETEKRDQNLRNVAGLSRDHHFLVNKGLQSMWTLRCFLNIWIL